MELQFNKSVIPCLRTVAREVQTQEQTQEVRLSDGMPDIGRVLASWGQVLLRGKEWRGGGAGASGGVMAWVLYAPEDGSEVRCVETWLPFQMKWDFPDTGRDGTLCVSPMLRSIDARSLSGRKLMVRATVGVLGQAMVPGEGELYTPTDLPEDVFVLRNTYPIQIPVETGEKMFNLEESLTLPASVPEIEKIIRYTLNPVLTDSKVVADKLVMRGVANLELLYRGVDGQLHTWRWELPFSQYAELDKQYDNDATARIWLAVTALELEQGEEEKLAMKADIIGQYVICHRQCVEVVADAYSPVRSVVPETAQMNIPSILDDRTETVAVEHTMETDAMQVVDVTFYPDHPLLRRSGDAVNAELSGQFQMLGYNSEGQLESMTGRWQDNKTMEISENTDVEMAVSVDERPQAAVNGENVSVQAEMRLNTQTVADRGIPMVTGLELGETRQPDPNRPSLILRRAGNDSLWEIAKHTGSTVEAIKSANSLSQEPHSEQMLLIPIS